MDGNLRNKKKMIKNIIFDFDGTLADTSNLIVATMQKTNEDLGLPYRTAEQIKTTIGVRLEEIPFLLWPNITGLGESFGKIYRENFEKIKNEIPIKLFPGVAETLSKLKEEGYSLALATSRSHKSAVELTQQLGIQDYLNYIVGGDDVLEGKPNPESIYKILKELRCWPDESMMVGDMLVDVKMGKNAGVKTCAVTYGNGDELELKESGADYIFSDFSDLGYFFSKTSI